LCRCVADGGGDDLLSFVITASHQSVGATDGGVHDADGDGNAAVTLPVTFFTFAASLCRGADLVRRVVARDTVALCTRRFVTTTSRDRIDMKVCDV
jgi:hypothetical protein